MRKMRAAAGMTTEFAAGLLGVPRTNVPNMESGRSGISPERVRTLAANYGCANQGLVDALADMAGERVKGWWRPTGPNSRPLSWTSRSWSGTHTSFASLSPFTCRG